MIKFNKWTLGLAAVGAVTLPSVVKADENPSPVLTALSSTTISGYVDTSAQWNPGTGNVNNPGYAYGGASKADGFNLNAVELTIQRDADAKDGWGAGYRVDMVFGPDANTLATLSNNSFSSGNADFAIRQAYVDLKAPIGNGLDIKVGVWNTLLGYEVFESGNNPNFTRSYGYTIEPTTHTGILLSYQIADFIGVSAGVANTYGPTINGRAFPARAEWYKAFTGSVSLTAPKDWGFIGGSTLYGAAINGFNSGAITPTSSVTGVNQTSFYVGGTLNTPLKQLKLGASYDYAGQKEQSQLFSPFSSYANATALYATWQVTEKLSLNGRGEYFTQTKANAFATLPSKVVAFTATAQYDLWKNVISRVEFRWDHQAAGFPNPGGNAGHAYGPADQSDALGGSRRNAYELIANVIYKF